ncbi:MAG: preprotein translocase subunit SecY [archaeon]
MGAIIDFLAGISQYLPEIKKSEKEITFKTKMLWTVAALIIFFVLANINLVGLDTMSTSVQQIMFAQTLLASEVGTLITAGIGPIVMASIFLQLFIGAQLIQLDIHSTEGRAKFQQLQKILAVALCFVEGYIYVGSGLLTPMGGAGLFNPMTWFLTLQIAIGSLILLYLDEIVSKYGIGSGVSLFIAAGVAGGLFWQTFLPPISSALNPALETGGILWRSMMTGDPLLLLPLIGVIIIFLVVVFAEGMHVNIPITMGYKGTGGRYPVKFLYVSNMPVILAMALFMNIRLWALFMAKIPFIGDFMNGISWAVQIPNIGGMSLLHGVLIQGITTTTTLALLQGVLFLVLLSIACVVFGWFWVQMGNQSTEAVAAQLERSGMQIPGFRRDKRVIEKVLERYIPPITILGSIFVALLAGMGDFVLAGVASGTGILLTVGIVYRFYEEIAKTQQEAIGKLLGKMN